jgi:hypothetical protein
MERGSGGPSAPWHRCLGRNGELGGHSRHQHRINGFVCHAHSLPSLSPPPKAENNINSNHVLSL